MSLSKKQQNLITNLRAPVKSFRVFALEEIIRTGDTPEVLPVLEEIKEYEEDTECALLISHAISAINEYLNKYNSANNPEISNLSNTTEINYDYVDDSPRETNNSSETVDNSTKLVKDNSEIFNNPSELLKEWEESDDDRKLKILASLPSDSPVDIAKLGPELLKGSSSQVEAKIIKIFSKNWPEENFYIISDKINSEDIDVRIASLEAIVKYKPNLLLNNYETLLSTNNAKIKILTIKGLSKVDKQKVIDFLQKQLQSDSTKDRLEGIMHCRYLPFEITRSLILDFFEKETIPELLTKASCIIEKNPEKKLPFRLYEIAEHSSEEKADIVYKTINTIIKELEKPNNIIDNQQKGNTVTKQPYNQAEPPKQPEEEQQQNQHTKKDSETSQPPANNTSESSNTAQLKMLATITPEKAKAMLKQITLMISHKNTSVDLKISALKCLTRCKLCGAEDIASKFISHNDIKLAIAAVEYVGAVNPDYVFPYLGQCINIPNLEMKTAAINILKPHDCQQAISYLRTLLHSNDSKQQDISMECLKLFEFNQIREMLTELLCLDYPDSLLEKGLSLFEAKPSSENVYPLYKIEQAHKGDISEKAKELRKACPQPEKPIEEESKEEGKNNISNEKDKNKEKDNKETKVKNKPKVDNKKTNINSEAELKERLKAEKGKIDKNKINFVVRSAPDVPERTSLEQLKMIWNALQAFIFSKALPISIIVLIISAVVVYYTFIYTGTSKEVVVKGGPLITKPTIIEGVIDKIDDDIVYLKANNKETYILTPSKDNWETPAIGRIIRCELIPYRRTTNGEIIANFSENGFRYVDEKISQEEEEEDTEADEE